MPVVLSDSFYGPTQIEPDCKISYAELDALHETVGVSTKEELYDFLQIAGFGYRQANSVVRDTTPSQRKREMERVSLTIRKLVDLLGDPNQPGSALVHTRYNELVELDLRHKLQEQGLNESASALPLEQVMRALADCAQELDERADSYPLGRRTSVHNPGLKSLIENIFRFWLKLSESEREGEFSYYLNINTQQPNLATRLVIALVGAIDPDVETGSIKNQMLELTPQRREEIAAQGDF